jgi:hypothetical protein
VVLSFDNVKELVKVPFAAITAFADPSVKFGLQFRHMEENFDEEIEHAEKIIKKPSSSKPLKGLIQDSGASNVITLDSFRKKND